MTEGAFLSIHAKLDKSFRDPEAKELRLSEIALMDDLIEKQTKAVKVLIPEEIIDDDFVSRFKGLVLDNKGLTKLSIHIRNGNKGIDFKSSKKIDAKGFMISMDEFPEIQARIMSQS